MSEVPLYGAASEQIGNNFNGFKDVHLPESGLDCRICAIFARQPYGRIRYRVTLLTRQPLSIGPSQCSGTSPPYRGTSLIRNYLLLGPYSRPLPRALW